MTQADSRVFSQSYGANCSSVDGQAAFRDEESDHRHIDYFQSLEKSTKMAYLINSLRTSKKN
jgi:hypothetical protein